MRWMIKNDEGVVQGPFSTEEILQRIRRSELTGEEWIAPDPGGQWVPISKNPEFYDQLLEALSGAAESEPPEPEFSANESESSLAQEPTPTPEVSSSAGQDEAETEEFEVQPPPRRAEPERNRRSARKKRRHSHNDDLELVDVRKKVRKEIIRRAWLPTAVVAAALAAGLFLVLIPQKESEERVRLLLPRVDVSENSSQAKAKISRGLAEFVRDTFSGYMRAQNEFVQAAEGDSRNAELYALLCLTYLELWPFAFQDSTDLKTVTAVTQRVGAVDPAGPHSATCKTVDLMLRGRYGEAKNLSDTILETYGQSAQPPVQFYYLKAILLEASGELGPAIDYLAYAQRLWPQWLRPFAYQAALMTKADRESEAAKVYRAVLTANPQHETAKIELGLLEYRAFRNPQKAEELIKSALRSSDRVVKKVLSRGLFGLAEIALERRDAPQALAYARQAYEADSTNALAKNLVVQLGGSKELKKTRFKAYQLIAEGDQFFREGDCNAAQAHYKAAFEVDKKNAVAAMKAGECLWRLSLSTEAIDWLNRAIRADEKLISAYVTLSDYYSQRFNFNAAAQVLASAQRVAPKSYEVLRGFAMIEMRRNNPKGAADFARQALALYDTDVDSHVIRAEAALAMGDAGLAFTHAAKAVELDGNHRRAQVTYGRSLAAVKGMQEGLGYLQELVTRYPLVADYRIAWGKLLLEDERFSDAERVFRQQTELDENSKEAFLQLGRALRRQARYEESLEAYLRAAVLDPADSEPLFEAGLLYLEVGKAEEARTQLRRVLAINKLYPLVHYHLGRAALSLGDPKQALEEAKLERKVNPELAEAYLLAADAYSQMGQFSMCVAEYQKAIKLRPQSAQNYVKIAQCYRKSDQLDVAMAMLDQAAVRESGLPDIYREKGIVFELKGDLLRAVEAYNQYFVLSPNAPDRSAIEERIQVLQRGGR